MTPDRRLLAVQHHLWKDLHAYSIIPWNESNCRRWFGHWLARIPIECVCKRSFEKIIAIHPPRFGCEEDFREWGIAIHNVINVKLGKETYTK